MSLDFAFFLNKRSVAFFQHGYLDCAIANIEAALYELSLQDIFLHRISLSSPSANPTKCPAKATRLMEWTKVCAPGRIQEDGNTEETSMYNYALILSADHQDWTNEASRHAARAALEYNLAFVYHWRAMHLGMSSNLTTALGHYERAWNAINQVEEVAGMEHLALAVLNNTVHIHRQLMHNSQARNCLDVLRLLISKLAGSLSLLETMEDYDTFIVSAMLPTSDLEIAPAA